MDRNADSKVVLSLQEILAGVWNMGVPKSKISHSRKRMRHAQHIPKKVNWYVCERCGESRKPHRVCLKNTEICALREDEWQARKMGASIADPVNK